MSDMVSVRLYVVDAQIIYVVTESQLDFQVSQPVPVTRVFFFPWTAKNYSNNCKIIPTDQSKHLNSKMLFVLFLYNSHDKYKYLLLPVYVIHLITLAN